MTDNDRFRLNEERNSSQALPVIEPPKCDVEKYREHVREFDLTTEEEAELLKNLWLIMASFVDLGFGVDSIQFLPSSDQKHGLMPASLFNEPSEKLKPNRDKHDD